MTTVRFPWRSVVLIALLLCAWAPFKLLWEEKIAQQQDRMRYGGVVMSRSLRDQLTQGLSIGVLAGLRSVVADFVWIDVTIAWEKYEWFKMDSLVNLCTSLQPRSVIFWDYGGWQLAWNVSIAAEWDASLEKNPLRRLHDSRFWVNRGLDVLKRGIANNPQSYELWERTAQCYYQRLKDYKAAAYYYREAAIQPGAPVFLERFEAYMYEDAHDDPEAYDAWKRLWLRLTPAQREQKQHWKEKIESHIRSLENKLNIPLEKRVFPK
jgi:tetratricopeptide (TPR) repeat protein